MAIQTNLIILGVIALIGIGSLVGIFYKMKDGFGPFNLKVYGLTLVIIISALLTLSENINQNLTVCYSILGAIAGYLFGLKKEQD